MKVASHLIEGKSNRLDLLKREVEEAVVVGLKAKLSAVLEQIHIDGKIASVGEPALGVALLRPGIGEVKEDRVNAGRREHLGKVVRGVNEELEVIGRAALHILCALCAENDAI